MIRLTNILAEIKVNDPGQQILFGLKNDGSWTELVKIKGYSDSKKALEKINKLFNLYGDDAFYSSWMQTPKLNNIAYAYLAGDGDVSFVNSLSDFSPGFQTEEGWGVAEWSTKAPK